MVAAFQLDSAVREARARSGVPGVAAGLSVRGEVTAVADGVLELGRDEPARADTPFRIASVSKPFAAALAAACLPLKGEIVSLLSHSAGFRLESERPLPAEAEGLWSYSNAGYWRAGALCAEACGTTFEEAMRARVLAPGGLDSTGYEEPAAPARGHVQEGETGHRPVTVDGYPRERRPSGGLWSTVGDLLRFGEAQLASPAPVFEPQAAALGAQYALGWWVRTLADGVTAYDHEGSVAGYQSLLLLVPEGQLVLAVLTNSWRGSGLIRRIVGGLGLLPSQPAFNEVAAEPGRYALDGVEAVVEAGGDGVLVRQSEVDPVTGARIAAPRYRAQPLGGAVYGLAGGALMSHRLDFPRAGIARIGWTALPRVEP
jgi:CubicO group peptidase (beta-lactamase class C family)